VRPASGQSLPLLRAGLHLGACQQPAGSPLGCGLWKQRAAAPANWQMRPGATLRQHLDGAAGSTGACWPPPAGLGPHHKDAADDERLLAVGERAGALVRLLRLLLLLLLLLLLGPAGGRWRCQTLPLLVAPPGTCQSLLGGTRRCQRRFAGTRGAPLCCGLPPAGGGGGAGWGGSGQRRPCARQAAARRAPPTCRRPCRRAGAPPGPGPRPPGCQPRPQSGCER
jgi:hypothetical protein